MIARRPASVLLVVACVGAACAKSPIDPAGAVTILAPIPAFPPNGATIAAAAQPITLTIRNGSTTDPVASIVYTFEVAADRGFGFKIVAKDVAETGSETSLRLDTLAADQQYFWRVRAAAADTLTGYTEPVTFTVTSATVSQLPAPTAVSPPPGSTVASNRPTLTIANSAGTSSGAVTYWFEIATDEAFVNVAAAGGAAAGSSQTSFTPGVNLSFKTTYYWRARAIDVTTGALSPFSATSTFATASGS